MIDAPVLLKDLQSQLRLLEADLRRRLEGDPLLRETLEREHAQALAVKRTAASFGAWRDERVTQAAVAWLLAFVFVRFGEDNHLIADVHLAGPGEQGRTAADAQTHYFQQHPTHNDRDWLLSAFHALSAYPAAAPLFDERHNPLWQLPISADAASGLLEFWRRRDTDSGALVHDFRDSSWETRFLGDLYQDLSDSARKTYALLQTPDFVEEFLLDRTLEPAITERGLNGLRMIDPACGSGHFLLGGFKRLLAHWRDQEPGTDERTLVQRALDSVHGIDINPFAVAIARFRLTIAALKESGLRHLADAPAFSMHLAVGDSLLHGRIEGIFPGTDDAALRLSEHAYATEDVEMLREMLDPEHPYDVVVGNPPYIQPKDPALNVAYRKRYASCAGKYALSVPFAERFFQLARHGNRTGFEAGRIGMITSNSFMKREFGKRLIERALPKWDITHVLDTSGAHIPGHNTPTVILLGRRRAPGAQTVRVAMTKSGASSTPVDSDKGVVWRALVEQVDRPGSDSEHVSVEDFDRKSLGKHPWSIGGGGAVHLRELIESSDRPRVTDMATQVGIVSVTGEDDLYLLPDPRVQLRLGIKNARRLVLGDVLRDWVDSGEDVALWPYNADYEVEPLSAAPSTEKLFWSFRSTISRRKRFGTPMVDRGLAWYEWQELYTAKLATKLAISWGEVATHNNFVFDRSGKLFNRTAPVIKLPEGASEGGHLGLMGILNSSTVCFWLKQVCHNKGAGADSSGARQRMQPFEDFYALNSRNVSRVPVPHQMPTHRARALDSLAQRFSAADPSSFFAQRTPTREQLVSRVVSIFSVRV